MNILVVAGGLGPERDVSLSSGRLITTALLAKGYHVAMINISDDLEDECLVNLFQKKADIQSLLIPEKEPLLMTKELVKKHAIGKNVLKACKLADVVFIGLHGDIGENGKFQALLDIYDIKYTGTDSLGSAIAMDKDISKQLLKYNNIATPNWIFLDLEHESEISHVLNCLSIHHLLFPVVVKPISCGSSIGVRIAHDESELQEALNIAGTYENHIIIEQFIEGREMTVAILNNAALPIIEIKPKCGFFDYKNKYQSGLTEEICPANVNESLKGELQRLALKAHKALRLGSYSRIDFIVDDAENIYCLEANTLPGMTVNSLLPKAANAMGYSYEDLCELLLKS